MFIHYYETHIEPMIQGCVESQIVFLRRYGILKQLLRCNSCGTQMNECKYNRSIDGIAFICYTNQCRQYKKYISIRTNSWLEDFNVSLKKCVTIIWKWYCDVTQKEILQEVNVSESFMIKFMKKLRKSCKEYFEAKPVCLGGNNIVCQIDESLFRHKPKNHRGRATAQEKWVFGIADTSFTPSKVYLELVQNRSANSLIPIINRICRTGSIIISDQWRAYTSLSANNKFEYYSVNHNLYFVDPETLAHTQNIESYWAVAKLKFKKQKGVYGNLIQEYLYELMFKRNVCKDDFNEVLNLLKLFYS